MTARPDPYGLWRLANEVMLDYEHRLYDTLVELRVLDDGMLAPWYKIEDIVFDPQPGDRPRLPFGEVYEDQAPPPAQLGVGIPKGTSRELDL